MRSLAASLVVCALALLGRSAVADSAPAPRDWHVGFNLRTDLAAHPVRVDGGARFDHLDLILVLDPMFWTDGQHDVELLAQWQFTPLRWAVFGGWRPTAIGVDGGRQFQHKLVAGVAAGLPSLGTRALRGQAGLELAVLLVKHGADLATDWISVGSARGISDYVRLGMFVRFEYASPF